MSDEEKEAVRSLFDNWASSYEKQVIEDYGYQAPYQTVNILGKYLEKSLNTISKDDVR